MLQPVKKHYPDPKQNLEEFKRYVHKAGFVVLILPVETNFTPTLEADSNQHLYCWTFQTITNLLLLCGWQPLRARVIYGPFLLRTLNKWLNASAAVGLSKVLGRIKKNFPSMLVLARLP